MYMIYSIVRSYSWVLVDHRTAPSFIILFKFFFSVLHFAFIPFLQTGTNTAATSLSAALELEFHDTYTDNNSIA